MSLYHHSLASFRMSDKFGADILWETTTLDDHGKYSLQSSFSEYSVLLFTFPVDFIFLIMILSDIFATLYHHGQL